MVPSWVFLAERGRASLLLNFRTIQDLPPWTYRLPRWQAERAVICGGREPPCRAWDGGSSSRCSAARRLRGPAHHFVARRVTGDRSTLICRVPVSTRPIMTRALANIQIVINRLLRSLCITKGPPLVERRAPPTKGESTRLPGWAQASRQRPA